MKWWGDEYDMRYERYEIWDISIAIRIVHYCFIESGVIVMVTAIVILIVIVIVIVILRSRRGEIR